MSATEAEAVFVRHFQESPELHENDCCSNTEEGCDTDADYCCKPMEEWDAPLRFALRQALASHLAYVMGKMPEEVEFGCDAREERDAYNDCRTDCLSILQAEIDALVGKDNESSL